MKETIESIIKWSAETFPNATRDGQCAKFQDEKAEYIESRELLELVDMFIVACGIARFDATHAMCCFATVERLRSYTRWTNQDFATAIDVKMAINRKRRWNIAGGKYQHVEE